VGHLVGERDGALVVLFPYAGVGGAVVVGHGRPAGLADEAVKKFADGAPVKKVIYVQDRLVNLVV